MNPSSPHLRVAQRDGRPFTLPKYYPPEDKYGKRPVQTWVSIPISVFGLFRFKLVLPNLKSAYFAAISRFGRMCGVLMLVLLLILSGFMIFAFVKRFGSPQKKWPGGEAPTLVFKREDLGKIWRWEIASGHHPSQRSIPQRLGLNSLPDNPSLPPNSVTPSRFKTTTKGVGPNRLYIDIQSKPPSVAYPPRPVSGSIADLDVIIEHCDFGEGKFVRDCLEVLRVGGGLDNGNRIRRGRRDDWKYIYVEDAMPTSALPSDGISERKGIIRSEHEAYLDEGFTKSRHAAWEPPLVLPPPDQYLPHSVGKFCDDDPRLFHMYWTGPFTDKPYLAVLSFLFTQNTGLHRAGEEGIDSCTPQLWIWVNPGPAAAVSDSATLDLVDQLKTSEWAAPFLHPRFKNTIHFKLWNTAEQLDSLSETRDDWRSRKTLFKSGGVAVGADGNSDLVNRTGSQSADLYDKLSVIVSDMARFVLCHKHGGIYVDADTLFLRDWEEMWGWKGAFAYRWSFHDKYNTAVLRLRKGSALGHFLLRTAVKNGFDFHPFEVTKYLKQARMDSLLTRLPDAMFDGAWLNMEGYQRERPPQPYFTAFEDFFVTPLADSGAPLALGFQGFFSGAYSYHFHNSWWKPVDAAMNWPDLGPNFQENGPEDHHAQDRRDLDWSTVLKRTFEAYIRGEIPNMYGEYLVW
ncbi:hypothetical protein DFH08DRAFT_109150 [Mycena albidolilacea]|uniref:Glycosyltransferase family 32 protein n=1 Tax=Mycena albidolilacea TaxID=1033008 RepID=A0AAD7ET13_9AGAR|nr:hypothetical protein DFH08DRAFT_109150 [Mycena albidolilacea]